jgi:DnaD/phage-associated family protein
MSATVCARVWELPLPRDQKLVLLAYADHASHDGTNIYPSVYLVARKSGYSERSVQKITRALQAAGWLLPDGRGPMQTNRWRFPLERCAAAPLEAAGTRDPESADVVVAGAGVSRFAQAVHSAPTKGEAEFTPGVNPAAPKPSLQPSLEPEEEDESQPAEKRIAALSQLYEQNIGAITPLIADSLRLAAEEFPAAWYRPAFAAAARNNVRRWSYVQAVLDGWRRNGFGWKPGRQPEGSRGPDASGPPRGPEAQAAEPRAFDAVRRFAHKHGVHIDG